MGLSNWTDEQIAILQKDMQSTLKMAGFGDLDDKTKHIRMKTLEQKVLPSAVIQPSEITDFAAEIKRQQQNQKQATKKEEEVEKDPLYDFDDEIIHTGNSDDEDDEEKQSKYDGDSMNL